jgi:aerobic-type carbon monoxide dehydrogenase small subunit (CoxS/CutS family)
VTDDQHQEGTPRSAGRWDPLPQGDYDDGATAFVKLPEGGVDALLASADSPLAAPGHGYVPPQITVNPATSAGTDPAATGQWTMPAAPRDGVHWPDPNAVPHGGGDDRFTYNPGATGQWHFEETGPAEGAQPAPAPGHDVTGQWSIPVADGDLPDESGEFTTSSLVEQWGGTPPATLPGGAPAPWATEAAGRPWGRPPGTEQQPTGHETGHDSGAGQETGQSAGAGHETGHHAGGHGYEQPAGPGHERLVGSEYAHGRPAEAGYEQSTTDGHAHDRQADTWSGHERSATADDTRHHTQGGTPSDGYERERHAAPEAYAAERHAPEADEAEAYAAERRAPEARVTDPHAPEADEPGSYAQEGHAAEAHGAEPHGPEPHGSETYAHAPVEPDGHEPPGSHRPEQSHARASEQAQPLPPERRPSEVHTEASAEAAADASRPAHGPGEALEAAEAAQEAAGAVAAAERAAEDAAEPIGLHEHAQDAAAGTESGAEAAAEEPADPGASDGSAPPPSGEEHPLASYVLRVNGVERPVTDAWIGESLLYVLRERLGLAGAKDGCSQGECGACNVQVDGRLVASCLVPAVTAAGSEVRTVEGLAVDGQPSDVQRALAKCGAVQCGFCVPGMAMTVHDLLEGNPAPTELETRQALCGNLCRCSGYRGVVDAVKEVVAEREAHSAADAGTDADEPRIPHQAGPGAGGVHSSAFEPAGHDQAYGHGQDGGQA